MTTIKINLQQEYKLFKLDWDEKHSISKCPSFTSWKQFYRIKNSDNKIVLG